MKKVDQVKHVIDLKKVEQFISDARAAADTAEELMKTSIPDDDKRVQLFDAFVKLGLCDESELPSG